VEASAHRCAFAQRAYVPVCVHALCCHLKAAFYLVGNAHFIEHGTKIGYEWNLSSDILSVAGKIPTNLDTVLAKSQE
jgi:hypothetical protein